MIPLSSVERKHGDHFYFQYFGSVRLRAHVFFMLFFFQFFNFLWNTTPLFYIWLSNWYLGANVSRRPAHRLERNLNNQYVMPRSSGENWGSFDELDRALIKNKSWETRIKKCVSKHVVYHSRLTQGGVQTFWCCIVVCCWLYSDERGRLCSNQAIEVLIFCSSSTDTHIILQNRHTVLRISTDR